MRGNRFPVPQPVFSASHGFEMEQVDALRVAKRRSRHESIVWQVASEQLVQRFDLGHPAMLLSCVAAIDGLADRISRSRIIAI